MKKLLVAFALAVFAFTASAQDTMWPNKGVGIVDPTLVTKVETHPLDQHLQDMKVSYCNLNYFPI